MRRLFLLLVVAACTSKAPESPEMARWRAQAANVTITRDDWGIAHVKGKTDADAVFGMVYAQAEDDFNRIEMNYLTSLGRLAEAEGARVLYRDLRARMYVDHDTLKALYAASPDDLKTLMNAWADGLNFYLATHPTVKPKVLTAFEPWMALSFSEGSIGGDIEDVSLRRLEAFYGEKKPQLAEAEPVGPREPSGSNGIAIAPANTTEGKALLLINPHTSFFFRSELQMTSDQGLNAYGAVTWGQFFVYQGFNDKTGWMHTSSGADVVDEFAETVVRRGDSLFYRVGKEERQVSRKSITLSVKGDSGATSRTFEVFSTHHGPVVKEADGKWIATKIMNTPLTALTQSWSRTKARNYKEFRASMELHTNSSNNTIYADAEGNIAYFHANHVARRNPRLNYDEAVDGSNPAADWNGVHGVEESPFLLNPPVGWLYNTNNWPYSAAGPNSPKKKDYPAYMERYQENPRGVHAIRVLQGRKDFTIANLIGAAYDSYMPAFADLIPTLVKAWDSRPQNDSLKARTADQIAVLRDWDYRWDVASVPTSVAVYWGDDLWRRVAADADNENLSEYEYMATRTSAVQKLEALAAASDTLTSHFGKWNTPWGDINRFQRLTGDIVQPFDDAGPSIPVGFASARWGSLASFGATTHNGTKKRYGTSGNSFVAVVQFGADSVKARAVSAGGEHGDPTSKHFNDQAQRYATGDLREVYFYPAQLAGHTTRTYTPGQ